MRTRSLWAAAAGALLIAAAGCSIEPGGGGMNAENNPADAGGVTRTEAMGMPLEEQFELVRERDARMRELLTEAQEQITTEEWIWGSIGMIPDRGANAYSSLPGMESENSYSLVIGRILQPEDAAPTVADLDPMIEYFESKGWEYETYETGQNQVGWTALADTGEGYWVEWQALSWGVYSLVITGGTYWGDSDGLLREVGDRFLAQDEDIESSAPGVFIDFPDWDDPKETPELLSHHHRDEEQP